MHKSRFLMLSLLAGLPPLTQAADTPIATPFQLGTITVTASAEDDGLNDQVAARIDQDTMQRYERHTVTEALNLLPGVTTGTNLRNEGLFNLRGFDARQAPIFLDGIPVSIPYDGYVDLDRFTTGDLAAIQVAKGMSSMMYGPNTLGGAINLVTRQPERAFEGDVLLGGGSNGLLRSQLNVGSRQSWGYLQAGLSQHQADDFRMSRNFRPTPREDGGRRENSDYQDSRQSLKLGLTPTEGSEYVFGWVRQNGEKGQPTAANPAVPERYWRWPYWDKESVYFLGTQALGSHETLRLRAFHDEYGNGLLSYTDGSYSTLHTTADAPPRRGPVSDTGGSFYDDRSFGGSIQLESRRFDGHHLKMMYFLKRDRHLADNGVVRDTQMEDELTSVAIEDLITLAPRWQLSLGAGHDRLRPLENQRSSCVGAAACALPPSQSARNFQVGLYHDLDAQQRLYASIARKSRLPTLKDRYSQRLGTFIPNPDLGREQALHYELGYQGRFERNRFAAAIFQSELDDLIQSVPDAGGPGLAQMQNIDRARYRGLELEASRTFSQRLEAGIGYTRLLRENLSNNNRLVDTPGHKLTAQGNWRPHERWQLTGLIEHAGTRWASNTVQLKGYTTAGVKAALLLTPALTLETGVDNLADRNIELADGFPEPGRRYYANLRYRF